MASIAPDPLAPYPTYGEKVSVSKKKEIALKISHLAPKKFQEIEGWNFTTTQEKINTFLSLSKRTMKQLDCSNQCLLSAAFSLLSRFGPLPLFFKKSTDNRDFIKDILKAWITELQECSSYLNGIEETPSGKLLETPPDSTSSAGTPKEISIVDIHVKVCARFWSLLVLIDEQIKDVPVSRGETYELDPRDPTSKVLTQTLPDELIFPQVHQPIGS